MAKTLNLTKGGISVDYITDLIQATGELTITQIKDRNETGAGSVVISDTAVAAGLFDTLDEYNLGDFITFATDNAYTLTAYETGADAVVVYEP